MRKPILFSALLLFYFAASAQDSTFLPRAVARLGVQPAQEKVYLHLDKPNYGYGDTIWYKAYTVVGQKHQLSALSGDDDGNLGRQVYKFRYNKTSALEFLHSKIKPPFFST